MSEPLHVLILEDNPVDAELVQFELQEAEFNFTAKVVMDEKDFILELQEFPPDLILSDYDLPRYNGAKALAAARRIRPDTPFILVTGAVSEDRAIEILTQGAKDYVLKNRLQQRLIPAIQRALAEAEEHRARKQAENKLREAHRTMEQRVKTRTAELEAEMEARKKMEEALRDSEERQRLVLQASSIGTFEVDLLTGEGQWNATEFELLGLKPGNVNVSPDTFFRFVHPDDIVRLRNEWAEATQSGKLDAEFRIVRADGRECWLAGKGTFIFDGHSDGHDTGTSRKPLRFMGVNFDITGRKKAEEALAAAHSQVQGIIDNTTAIIYAFDLEGRFVMANTTVAELLNSTPEKMIGKRRHDFMPKDDADWHEANDRQVIEAGRPLEFEEYSELKDRSITWLTTKFPLRDAQGRIYAVAGISADISERKQAEEALRQSEELFRVIFTESSVGKGIADPATKKIIKVNAAFCRITGYSEEELLQRTFLDIHHPDDRGRTIAAFEAMVRGKTSGYHQEKRYLRPDGGVVWVDAVTNLIRDRAGIPFRSVTVIQAVTERKQTEEALKQQSDKLEAANRELESGPRRE